MVQKSSMQVQQRSMLAHGFDNGRKLLLQHGGRYLGHCVTELVRVTTKDIGEDKAERVKLAVKCPPLRLLCQ
jgi:hypothetical protein